MFNLLFIIFSLFSSFLITKKKVLKKKMRQKRMLTTGVEPVTFAFHHIYSLLSCNIRTT